MAHPKQTLATAESMAHSQREIAVSEFFLKNRHLLGFDNPRKALLTTVKEAVDNSLDACDEAGILPEISVEIAQTGARRFRVTVLDNGPGIVRAQIPKIFAKLLYGSKFHRLRMSRGQQGIGISAAGMYGQLTTGTATIIQSKIKSSKSAHYIEVQIDTRANKPTILKDEELEWHPQFFTADKDGAAQLRKEYTHGTCVSIEMEAAYIRGKLSADEYLKQCAIVNPHLCLHYRIAVLEATAVAIATGVAVATGNGKGQIRPPEGIHALTGAATRIEIPIRQGVKTPAAAKKPVDTAGAAGAAWITFERGTRDLPKQPLEIKPHPHGVELGMLMQMLKDTTAKTLKSALSNDFSRVSDRAAVDICQRAALDPKARPANIAHRESEALFKAIGEAKLMRPPTDCLSPIGEEQILAGLKKEITADFYTAVTRSPEVYRGNPFQIEVGIAYAKPDASKDVAAEDPVRVLRFANKVPLLYMGGACAMIKAMTSVNWKSYGLAQPRDAVPLGPVVILIHIASVWVPFTSESKEAIAHYPEIIREMTFALQEAGRQLSVFLSRRRRQAELERKRNFIEMYLPHLALGLREILALNEKQETQIVNKLHKMLERTHLET